MTDKSAIILGVKRPRRRAFTLIEILATLTLVAIILPVAMKGLSLAQGTATSAWRQTEAAALAQSKMAEIVAEAQYQQNESQSGDFLPDYPDYSWTATMAEWQGTTLQELDVQVSWIQRNQMRSVMVSTLVYTGTGQ
jgi:prepilin-type N-terminal cleavage/methylation domain-containing protein